jgi:hypothetical protein
VNKKLVLPHPEMPDPLVGNFLDEWMYHTGWGDERTFVVRKFEKDGTFTETEFVKKKDEEVEMSEQVFLAKLVMWVSALPGNVVTPEERNQILYILSLYNDEFNIVDTRKKGEVEK